MAFDVFFNNPHFLSALSNTHTHTQISSTTLSMPSRNDHEPPTKHARTETPRIGAHAITHMGHLMLVVDNAHGTLCAYKVVYPHQDTSGTAMTVTYLVSLLEYCLVSGHDALDVCLHIKPAWLDAVVDRLTENFTRQPPPVQQYYYVNFLTMKTNLYR